MEKYNVRDARRRISELLDRVAEGEEVIVTRHGKPVARWTRPENEPRPSLPSLTEFRAGIREQHRGSAELIREERDER